MPRLNDEQRALAEHHRTLGLAFWWARRGAERYPSLATELESECLYQVVRAAARFRPERGTPWRIFLTRYLRNALARTLRANRPHGYRHRHYRHADAPPLVPLPRVIPSGLDPVGWEIESEETVRTLADKLTRRQRETVLAYYLAAGTELNALGRSWGCGRGAATEHHRAALGSLRKQIRR